MSFKNIFKPSLLLILGLFYAFSIATLTLWNLKGINSVTGDEPHYLVIASGIVKNFSLEQTLPYSLEFKNKEIYRWGLAKSGEVPSPNNTHAVRGPHGLYNVHNIGLPLILSLPFLLGGVIGSKIFMIFLNSIIVILTWKIAELFAYDKKIVFFSTLAVSVSLPFIPASNQIYPDLLAGSIVLSGIYFLITVNRKRNIGLEFLWITSISLLPWLHIKFLPACIVLITLICFKIYNNRNNYKIIGFIFIGLVSLVVLGWYNFYAFGHLTGPYGQDALVLNPTALMVFAGLILDQNQGILFQNPIFFVGAFASLAYIASNLRIGIIWFILFLSLILPNAMHPNWYGGGSFSGRFEWAGAVLFILPTIFGLIYIAKYNYRLFYSFIVLSVIIQIYFFLLYSFGVVDLYQKAPMTPLSAYSNFYYPFDIWLPALYNSDWAYSYVPNILWIVGAMMLSIIGYFYINKIQKNLKLAVGLFVLIIVALFVYNHFRNTKNLLEEYSFNAIDLPSQTGKKYLNRIVAIEGKDKAGFLSYGPYLPLRKGTYIVSLYYKSSAQKMHLVGQFDIYNADKRYSISNIQILGTDGNLAVLSKQFTVFNWYPNKYEFRNLWNGKSDLAILNIKLERLK